MRRLSLALVAALAGGVVIWMASPVRRGGTASSIRPRSSRSRPQTPSVATMVSK